MPTFWRNIPPPSSDMMRPSSIPLIMTLHSGIQWMWQDGNEADQSKNEHSNCILFALQAICIFFFYLTTLFQLQVMECWLRWEHRHEWWINKNLKGASHSLYEGRYSIHLVTLRSHKNSHPDEPVTPPMFKLCTFQIQVYSVTTSLTCLVTSFIINK
jgi:hypothetical protein